MRIAAAVLVLTLAAAAGMAAAPDATTVAAKMKGALEPDRPSVRRLLFRVTGPGGAASEMTVGQARKRLGGIPRVAMVVLAPDALRGTGLLVQESAAENVQWLYVPAVGRVRKLVSPEGETTFLNSDFTFADLGFVGMGTRWTQIGEEKREGAATYRLEGIPRDGWYYSRVVVWVAADTFLPVERDFFDVANALFKVQRWSDVTTVDGVPMALKTSMRNVQTDTTTEVTVDAIHWGGDVPDALFDANGLATAPASPVWQGLTGPVSASR